MKIIRDKTGAELKSLAASLLLLPLLLVVVVAKLGRSRPPSLPAVML